MLEERLGSNTTADRQYVWGLRYVDDLVLRETPSERLYALQDALFNVVALTNTSGAVVERFAYQAYGQSEELDPDYTAYSGTNYNWTYRFTGRELDLETGLHYYRHRYYHAQLGRFLSRDWLEYEDGYSLYSYVRSSPLNHLDSSGLATVVGTTPPPKGCWIYQEDAPTKKCYKLCSGIKTPMQCPKMPKDDPDGPSYLTGLNDIADGYNLLKDVCKKCAAQAGPGCTKEKCEEEAGSIVFRLATAWQQNYGNGIYFGHEHPVGGHYCWDWSTIFFDALKPKSYSCFKFKEWAATAPWRPDPQKPGHQFQPQHWFLVVQTSRKATCSVVFDDGYFHAQQTSHDPHGYIKPGYKYTDPANCNQGKPDCPHVPIGF